MLMEYDHKQQKKNKKKHLGLLGMQPNRNSVSFLDKFVDYENTFL